MSGESSSWRMERSLKAHRESTKDPVFCGQTKVKHVHENASVKGNPNLNVGQLCQWVNDDLLPNETLEPGFPRKVSMETARKWMIELGFSVVRKKKGTYVDGHEHEDVVDYCKTLLRKMVSLGF